jgi:heme/copper-type cytochrome/quinol oxidase subunit 2
MLLWFIVWIIIAIWVYKDAESRGMNGALWLIVVIILGIIGLIIYLLVRAGEKGKKEEIKRICPQCGRVIKEDVKFCPYCGKELA